MAKSELARLGPNASMAAKRYAIGNGIDSIDNRLGQLRYDNRFFNKTVKNVGQVIFRALGWNIGDITEGVGGVKDAATMFSKARRAGGDTTNLQITPRMAYIPAEIIGSAIIGSLWSYMLDR